MIMLLIQCQLINFGKVFNPRPSFMFDATTMYGAIYDESYATRWFDVEYGVERSKYDLTPKTKPWDGANTHKKKMWN